MKNINLKNIKTGDLINELYKRPDMVIIYPLNTSYIANVMGLKEEKIIKYSEDLNRYFNSDDVEDYLIDKISEFKAYYLD
jgi:hypothetical protein